MVVRVQDVDAVLLWESTTLSNVSDVETGQLRKGVQLVSLSQRIAAYRGRVAVRRLMGVRRENRMLKALTRLRRELARRPYEESELELLRAAWDGPRSGNTEDLSSLFCSELVAEAYQTMGLLPDDPDHPRYQPSNEFTPGDFCERSGQLHLLHGRLGAASVVSEE